MNNDNLNTLPRFRVGDTVTLRDVNFRIVELTDSRLTLEEQAVSVKFDEGHLGVFVGDGYQAQTNRAQ